MTPEEIANLEWLERHATPGPWWTGSANSCRWLRVVGKCPHPESNGSGEDYYGCHLPWDNADTDAELIVALRAHARELIDAAKKTWLAERVDEKGGAK